MNMNEILADTATDGVKGIVNAMGVSEEQTKATDELVAFYEYFHFKYGGDTEPALARVDDDYHKITDMAFAVTKQYGELPSTKADLYEGERHPLEWYEYFPEPYRQQAIHNFNGYTFANFQRRRGIHTEKCDILSSLSRGFLWFKTPQGRLYWSSFRNRLRTRAVELVGPTVTVTKQHEEPPL